MLEAARAGAKGRVIAVVEPHRYTRVRDLFARFLRLLHGCRHVIVAPLYSAGEAPIDGIDQPALAEGIRPTGHTSVTPIDDARDLVPADPPPWRARATW